jgi:hypothetical protein
MGVQNKNEPRPAFFGAGHKKRERDWWKCLKMRELEGGFVMSHTSELALPGVGNGYRQRPFH